MCSKKLATGILFVLLLFLFFLLLLFPSFKDVLEGGIITLSPSFQEEQDKEEEKEKEVEEREGVFSPGPLVKEDNAIVDGLLTERGIMRETNNHRENDGLAPLKKDDELDEVARIKLDNMIDKGYFAHISPSGKGVADIAEEVGYDYLIIGDNLARGNYKDDEDVVSAWMESPGHKENIMDERYEDIGIAVKKEPYEGRGIWMAVQVFGMPVSACPEVNKSLLERVEEKKEEAEDLKMEKESLKKEIEEMERGEAYVNKVEEYNDLVDAYNSLVDSLDSLIGEYNHQVKLREECINK